MKAQIIEEKDNTLMQRKEYWMIVNHDDGPTPSRPEMVEFLAKELKTKEELLIIDKMFSEKGKTVTKIRAEIYKKKEDIPKAKAEKSARRIAKTTSKKAKAENAAEPAAKEA